MPLLTYILFFSFIWACRPIPISSSFVFHECGFLYLHRFILFVIVCLAFLSSFSILWFSESMSSPKILSLCLSRVCLSFLYVLFFCFLRVCLPFLKSLKICLSRVCFPFLLSSSFVFVEFVFLSLNPLIFVF